MTPFKDYRPKVIKESVTLWPTPWDVRRQNIFGLGFLVGISIMGVVAVVIA